MPKTGLFRCVEESIILAALNVVMTLYPTDGKVQYMHSPKTVGEAIAYRLVTRSALWRASSDQQAARFADDEKAERIREDLCNRDPVAESALTYSELQELETRFLAWWNGAFGERGCAEPS
jgi:uncharacterized protein involved in type VI secretion and phage assembly